MTGWRRVSDLWYELTIADLTITVRLSRGMWRMGCGRLCIADMHLDAKDTDAALREGFGVVAAMIDGWHRAVTEHKEKT